MSRTVIILLTLILFFSFVGVAKADMSPPSREIIFYFQKAGQPFNQPVKFTVKCYRTSATDNKGELFKISELSGNCKTYGCKYDFSIFGWEENIKYCDLEGETGGGKFVINEFLGQSLAGLECHNTNEGWDISRGNIDGGVKYFERTSKYTNCMDMFKKEYFPDTARTMFGKCYDEGEVCYAERAQKEKLCENYLEDVTSEVNKIDKDEKGYLFDKICEIKVNIPSTSENSQQKTEPAPIIRPTPTKNFFVRTVDFFRCAFLKLFRKAC